MRTFLPIAICSASLAFHCTSANAQDLNRVPDVNQSVGVSDPFVHADSNADVLQKAQADLQPIQKTAKPLTHYSRWGFPTSGQPPATMFTATQSPHSLGAGKSNDLTVPGSDNLSFQAGLQSQGAVVWPPLTTESKYSVLPTSSLTSAVQTTRVPTSTFQRNTLVRTHNSEGLGLATEALDKAEVDHSHETSMDSRRFRSTISQLPLQPETDGFQSPFRTKQFGLASSPAPLPQAFPNTTHVLGREKTNSKSARHKQPPQKSPIEANSTNDHASKRNSLKSKKASSSHLLIHDAE